MMTAREYFKLAYGATRMSQRFESYERMRVYIPSKLLRDAVEYAVTERGDRLARYSSWRILKIQNDKRYYAANPHMRPGALNCRCVVLPIEVRR